MNKITRLIADKFKVMEAILIDADENGNSLKEVLEKIQIFEKELNYDSQLSRTEKDHLLIGTTIARYSLMYWEEAYASFGQDHSAAIRCGWNCRICVALADAIGGLGSAIITTPIGGIVGGAAFSVLARCCSCGCCGSNVSCEGQTNPQPCGSCDAVDNLYRSNVTCNTATINALGLDNEAGSYRWTITNADPASATTTDPSLEIAIVNPALTVTATIVVECSNGLDSDPYSQLFNFQQADNPQIEFANYPSNPGRTNPHTFTASHGTNGTHTLSWGYSPSYTIIGFGGNWANIVFHQTGAITIPITYTNNCTGESTTASVTVMVN